MIEGIILGLTITAIVVFVVVGLGIKYEGW